MPLKSKFHWPQSNRQNLRQVSGRFGFDTNGAIIAGTASGPGWSVAATGAGLATITLNAVATSFVAARLTAECASDDIDVNVQSGGYTPSTRALVVRINEAGTTADPSADIYVNFQIDFQPTSYLD